MQSKSPNPLFRFQDTEILFITMLFLKKNASHIEYKFVNAIKLQNNFLHFKACSGNFGVYLKINAKIKKNNSVERCLPSYARVVALIVIIHKYIFTHGCSVPSFGLTI